MKRTPIHSRRAKPRHGRVTGGELAELRRACWERDKGRCQKCGRGTYINGPVMNDGTYHMAHIHAKRNGGDSLENVETLCGKCHRAFHQYGPSGEKPCPPKPKKEERDVI